MQALPHHYHANAKLDDDTVILNSPELESINSGAPAEFGGPGDLWSPETLLAACIADCFILSFKAIARASRLSYLGISCDVEAILDRVEKVTRFTEVRIKAQLIISEADQEAAAEKILHKAESTCLITNSLTAEIDFETQISIKEG